MVQMVEFHADLKCRRGPTFSHLIHGTFTSQLFICDTVFILKDQDVFFFFITLCWKSTGLEFR